MNKWANEQHKFEWFVLLEFQIQSFVCLFVYFILSIAMEYDDRSFYSSLAQIIDMDILVPMVTLQSLLTGKKYVGWHWKIVLYYIIWVRKTEQSICSDISKLMVMQIQFYAKLTINIDSNYGFWTRCSSENLFDLRFNKYKQ